MTSHIIRKIYLERAIESCNVGCMTDLTLTCLQATSSPCQ